MSTDLTAMIITGSVVESKAGAALTVERVQLSDYATKLLRADSDGIKTSASSDGTMPACTEMTTAAA